MGSAPIPPFLNKIKYEVWGVWEIFLQPLCFGGAQGGAEMGICTDQAPHPLQVAEGEDNRVDSRFILAVGSGGWEPVPCLPQVKEILDVQGSSKRHVLSRWVELPRGLTAFS